MGRKAYVIAESDLNDTRLIRPPAEGGYGLDSQWSDDLHHALHTLLTGERNGYYEDFGSIHQLARAFRQGFVYSGGYSAHRRRRHGNRTEGCRAEQFLVCAQNHDQVGNRAFGDRLASIVPPEALKLAAGTILLSPFLPLLFMGEEYGETAPFLYFTSHGDPGLAEAVRKGRREEFSSFAWRGEIPDPQAEETFARSRLRPGFHADREGAPLLAFHRELLRLRRAWPPLAAPDLEAQEVTVREDGNVLSFRRWKEGAEVAGFLHFGDEPAELDVSLPSGPWRKVLDSAEDRWGGKGNSIPGEIGAGKSVRLSLGPWAVVIFARGIPSVAFGGA